MTLGRFHHVGIACADIEVEARNYLPLGYVQVGGAFVDEAQGVRGLFLESDGPRLELVENLPGSHVLDRFLLDGARMYHTAYWLEEALSLDEICQRLSATALRPITISPIFKCAIGFVLLPNDQILEFINVRP